MDNYFGKAGFHIGFFIMFVSGGLLFVVEPNSAEYSISLISFCMGLTFLLVIVALVKWQQWRNRL